MFLYFSWTLFFRSKRHAVNPMTPGYSFTTHRSGRGNLVWPVLCGLEQPGIT